MRETYGIGNTPMVELCEIEKKYNLKCKLFAKIEVGHFNGFFVHVGNRLCEFLRKYNRPNKRNE